MYKFTKNVTEQIFPVTKKKVDSIVLVHTLLFSYAFIFAANKWLAFYYDLLCIG